MDTHCLFGGGKSFHHRWWWKSITFKLCTSSIQVPAQVLPGDGTISPIAARPLWEWGNPPLCSRRAVMACVPCDVHLYRFVDDIALGISTYHRCGLRNTHGLSCLRRVDGMRMFQVADVITVSFPKTPWGQSSKDTTPCTRGLWIWRPRCLRHARWYTWRIFRGDWRRARWRITWVPVFWLWWVFLQRHGDTGRWVEMERRTKPREHFTHVSLKSKAYAYDISLMLEKWNVKLFW
jgi:hypothetical protein